jgi:hypothetical protein
MNLVTWSRSNVDYTRKLVNSALEGARSGEEGFLDGKPLKPFLNQSIRNALVPAATGASLGLLGCCLGNRRRSISRASAGCLVGCAIGFGLGLAWESRHLVAKVASSALKKVGKVRDEHWLEMHPIDYA